MPLKLGEIGRLKLVDKNDFFDMGHLFYGSYSPFILEIKNISIKLTTFNLQSRLILSTLNEKKTPFLLVVFNFHFEIMKILTLTYDFL